MRNQIRRSPRSEARGRNVRSIIYHSGDWPILLLAGCCIVQIGLAHPAQAAVTEAWVQRYNGPVNGSDYPVAVVVDASNNVVVTGASYNGDPANGAKADYYTAKYAAANGTLLWEKRYNGPANSGDRARALAVDGSGNVVVTGVSEADYYTAKYAAADGTLLWEKRYNGPANNYDEGGAVAVDSSGNVVVTGYSATDSGPAAIVGGYYTAKYAAADGTLLWEKRYKDPTKDASFAKAVAVDRSGNVVVTGSSVTAGAFAWIAGDYYTAKYAAVDGALLWEKRYNGPSDSNDIACALALDRNGNVLVTGYSKGFGGTHDYDYYTAKYAAADGALVWEKRYNGLANKYDEARAVAVDSSGNVVVTGISQGGMSSYYGSDYYTAKYAAADGALLWEQRYNGPATGDDSAQAVAVDDNGNVVVTGYSDGTFDEWGLGDADYYTAKYAAADGALLWEKRYNGFANGYGYDYASSLALGPNGMVAITGSSIGSSGTDDYATVVYRENLPPVAIELVSTGVRLRFHGFPGHSYNIERAPAVTGPWSTLATPTAPISGLIEYVDTNAPVVTAFYRTSTP